MKTINKKNTIRTVLSGTLLIYSSWQSAQAADKPQPWVASIVSEITRYGQSEACADGRALRKNHNNCATRDGAAITKIVCGTHDHVYKEKFWKGQCGTKAAKAFGNVEDVGEYFEKAIDQGRVDAIALACTPPLDQLRGKLRAVAQSKCRKLGTPTTQAESKAIAAEAVIEKEKLKQVPLHDTPEAKAVYNAIKNLNNQKITDNMAINAANMLANAKPVTGLSSKISIAISFLGDLSQSEKATAAAAIEKAIKEISQPQSGTMAVSQTPTSQPQSRTRAVSKTPTSQPQAQVYAAVSAIADLKGDPTAQAVYTAIVGLKNNKITQNMAVEAGIEASLLDDKSITQQMAAATETLENLTDEEKVTAKAAIKAALTKTNK